PRSGRCSTAPPRPTRSSTSCARWPASSRWRWSATCRWWRSWSASPPAGRRRGSGPRAWRSSSARRARAARRAGSPGSAARSSRRARVRARLVVAARAPPPGPLRERAAGSGLERVAARHLAVPASGLLQRPLAGVEVDPDEPEALGVALGPLEVVEQAPGVVAAHVGALLDRPVHGLEVAAVEVDAARVADHAGRIGPVAVRAAVLGDL